MKALALIAVAAQIGAFAAPSGLHVSRGSAELQSAEAALQIAASDRAILEWESFSSGADEVIRFLQPDAASLVLNRVTGENPSYLFGRLEANGKVVLVNPQGVFFGKDSVVDAGALIASTYDALDSAFIEKGELAFTGNSTASILVEGKIFAGEAVFAAHRVEHTGRIEAPVFCGIAAGGIVFGEKGFASAFRYEGSSARIGGEIKSRDVVVLGDFVFLDDAARIDASFDRGGGKVCIGGDFHGQNPQWFNAKQTVVASQAKIFSDGKINGDGGTVVVWSDEATVFQGFISSRGGEGGGNGGLVEVSGRSLAFEGLADRSAPAGDPGLLFLDPINIIISGPDSANVINPGGGGTYTFSACAPTPAIIDAGMLAANLAMGPVTVSTSAAGGAGCGDAGTLVVSSPVVPWTSANDLALIADGDITISGTVLNTIPGGGNLLVRSLGGSVTVDSVRVGSFLGDVTVEALGGDVNLLGAAGDGVIGFGSAMPLGTAEGDIFVSASRDVNLSGGELLTGGNAFISKNGPSFPAARSVGTLASPSNIVVNAGRNLNVLCHPSFDGWSAGIGNILFTPTAVQHVGDVTINVGNDCSVLGVDNFALIAVRVNPLGTPEGVHTTLRYNIGRDFLVGHNPGYTVGDSGGSIGAFSTAPVAMISSVNFRSAVYVNVGRNFIMDAQESFAFCSLTNDGSDPSIPKEMLIHVGGDLILRGGDDALGPSKSAAFDIFDTLGANLQFWARGSIAALNGENGAAHLHVAASPSTGALEDLGTVSVRAGGDIRAAGGGPWRFGVSVFDYYASGGISYTSDSSFGAGELWAPQTALVNGFNIFTGTPLQSSSGAAGSNGLGAVSFDHNFYNTNLQGNIYALAAGGIGALTPLVVTSPGNLITYGAQNGTDIFVSSRDRNVNGAAADLLNIGTLAASNRIQFSNALAGAPFTSDGQDITLMGWRDAAISGDPLLANAIEAPNGSIFVLTQRHQTLSGDARIFASLNIDLVTDNQAPFAPLIGNGGFFMDGTSAISSLGGYIRVYTARQNQNTIDPLAQFISGGTPYFFTPGTLFVDTDQEKWCTYFPFGDQGVPFKIFYKPCLQAVAQQATLIVDEFLAKENDFNYDIGWMLRFKVFYQTKMPLPTEPYFIRKPQDPYYNNHPKSYTSSSWD